MKIKPTQKQLDFLDWEFGMFFHFGIRSFFPGHKDWDGKPMPASAFHPKQLDCRQWIRLARKAGAKYAILTAKHHDGFALWPSKYSDYSVAQSDWEGGKGDVVKEFTDACRAFGVKVGIYYSPAQWGGTVKFENPAEYDDYFINQISELLTNYGEIDYLWFDGCGSENHEYDKARIIKTIRTLQPGIRIFSMWDPETRWVGNEAGYANMPNVNVVEKEAFSVMEDEERVTGTIRYLPAECDMRMRTTWFDCEANEDMIKSVDELMGIWEYSVGRGANLLLNIGPDYRGLLPDADAARLLEFGEALRERYGNALPFGDVTKAEDGTWHIRSAEFGKNADHTCAHLVDTVVIEEDITEGEAVEEFSIWCDLPTWGKPICVYNGCTIGHKAICRIPLMNTPNIHVRIKKADGEAVIKSIKAYRVNK